MDKINKFKAKRCSLTSKEKEINTTKNPSTIFKTTSTVDLIENS